MYGVTEHELPAGDLHTSNLIAKYSEGNVVLALLHEKGSTKKLIPYGG